MSTPAHSPAAASPAAFSPSRLFLASCIALIATAMTFAVRADISQALGTHYNLSQEQIGDAYAPAFFGFTIAIFLGGVVTDLLGMGALLALAFVMHASGLAATIFATGYSTLWTGSLLVGLGNGLIEAAVNPLIATIYKNDKTHKLNRLHVWFPGGIVIGGLIAFLFTRVGLGWQIKTAAVLVAVIAYGLLFLGQKYPPTERVASRVPTSDMFKELFRPLFLVLLFCMLLTAATELATGQFMPKFLEKATGANANDPGTGILVLCWVNGLMAIGRSFAGPIVHRWSPIAVLAGSSALAIAGLVGLSYANSTVSAFGAATVFAAGVCYFWPTMLGVTSERFPKGGSFLLGLMGAAGMLSVGIVLPRMGRLADTMQEHPELAFRTMAILPCILLVIFTAIYLYDRSRGGYKPEVLDATAKDAEPATASV